MMMMMIVLLTMTSTVDAQHLYRALRGLTQTFSATNSANFAGFGALIKHFSMVIESDRLIQQGVHSLVQQRRRFRYCHHFRLISVSKTFIDSNTFLFLVATPIDDRRQGSGRTGVASTNNIYSLHPLQSIIIEPSAVYASSLQRKTTTVQPWITRVDVEKYETSDEDNNNAPTSIHQHDNGAPVIRHTSDLFDKIDDYDRVPHQSSNENDRSSTTKVDQSQDFITSDTNPFINRLLAPPPPPPRRGVTANPRIANLDYHARNPFLISSAKFNAEHAANTLRLPPLSRHHFRTTNRPAKPVGMSFGVPN